MQRLTRSLWVLAAGVAVLCAAAVCQYAYPVAYPLDPDTIPPEPACDGWSVVQAKEPSRPECESFTGRVVAIVDGDTIKVMRDGKAVTVRLWGIDAPEEKQPYGDKARWQLECLLSEPSTEHYPELTTVDVYVETKDRYGRLVGWVSGVRHAGQVNTRMVRDGYAWWYEQYAPQAWFLGTAEARAKKEKRGLWAGKDPMPPWDWRRQDREARAAK